MLTPVRMRRVTVIVSKDQLTNFLSYAGQEGLLHFVTVSEKQIPTGASPFETTLLVARSAAIRNRLTTIAPILRDPTATREMSNVPVQSVEQLAEYLDKEALSLEQAVKQLEARHEKLQEEKERFVQLSRLLTGLERLGVRLDAMSSSGFTTILAGEAPRESVDNIRNELDRLSYGNAIFAITTTSDETEAFFAILPSAFQDEAKQALATLGARLEPGLAKLPPDSSEARKQVEQRLEEIREREMQLEHDKTQFAKENGPRYAYFAFLSEILDVRAKALSTALATQSTVLLDAWVPEAGLDSFSKGAVKVLGDNVSIQVDEHAGERLVKKAHEHSKEAIPEHVVEQELAPTLVKIPGWAKPLQSVVDNFGTPSYHEINPLWFMIISYPLIYGLMFGDVGQGILFLVGGFFLWRIKKKGTQLSDLWQIFVNGAELIMLLGVGILLFGIIFGDFFGFEPDFLRFGSNGGQSVPLYSPAEHLIDFMVIILIFGVFFINFGLALSTYNKIRNHEFAHAIFGPISWIIFYNSGVYLVSQFVLSGFKTSTLSSYPILIGSLVVSFGLMSWKEGPLHAIEAFLQSVSHTFSFLRIWALNIADFRLKQALVATLPAYGGIFGGIAGNIIVLIFEGLIVFVQALRLHWVEWFSKFYEGTGVPFAPYREPKGFGVAKFG